MAIQLRGRRLQHGAQKHGAIRHDQLPEVQTIENLNPVVPPEADLDDSLFKMVAIGGHPGRHRAIAFAHHAVRWDGHRLRRVLDANNEVREHSRT